jgi:hypothetical protein
MDIMRNILNKCLLVCAMTCISLISLTAQAHPLMPGAQQIGQAAFTRFGFSIYQAELWAPDGRYLPDQSFLLSLTYARNIGRTQIVQASLDEMQKLGAPVALQAQWRTDLEEILVDVKEGDILSAIYLPGQGAEFYFQNKKTGTIDEALARYFFGIWLDERTSEPKLRRSLIGQSQ